ncbi:PIN domain-containing protein [Candidatus Woesearchaeota archaeon]|nr:PIN domain-containing protein [Candidatus Woesearchaeota archaeon]
MRDTTEIKVFFADTYALIEITGGNPNYKLYVGNILLTTKFNLIELYYHFLHDYSKETADHYLQVYSSCLIPITNTSIQYGMEFKLNHKQEKLSYADCIGYALAQELGIPFLTGDQKFASKENVEFVK